MQQHIDKEQLLGMEQRQRAVLINSLGGFKSVCMIGTMNAKGKSNLACFSSLVHLGANPALLAFVMRPATVERHTLENILATNVFTVNHLNEGIYKQAHQTSASYPADVSEFEATGLTEEYKENFLAPFVKQSRVKFGMRLREKIDLTINNTSMIIGEIEQIYFPEDCLQEDGFVDLEKAGTLTCSGLDAYHSTKKLARLSHAKPYQALTIINQEEEKNNQN